MEVLGFGEWALCRDDVATMPASLTNPSQRKLTAFLKAAMFKVITQSVNQLMHLQSVGGVLLAIAALLALILGNSP